MVHKYIIPFQKLRTIAEFETIDDLAKVHSRPDFYFNLLQTLNPTWATMSKIVLRFNDVPDWTAKENVKCYQAERLGRLAGETLLTEILPLPASSIASWPYAAVWPDKKRYQEQVLPERLRKLRELYDSHYPDFVFCYGKGFWSHHKALFNDVEFFPILDGKVLLGRTGNTRVVLTPFFSFDWMSSRLIDRMVTELREQQLL